MSNVIAQNHTQRLKSCALSCLFIAAFVLPMREILAKSGGDGIRVMVLHISSEQCFSCQRGTFNAIADLCKANGTELHLSVITKRSGDLTFILPEYKSLPFDSVFEDVKARLFHSLPEHDMLPSVSTVINNITVVIPNPLHNLSKIDSLLKTESPKLNRCFTCNPRSRGELNSAAICTKNVVVENDAIRLITPTVIRDFGEYVLVLDNSQNKVLKISKRDGTLQYLTPSIADVKQIIARSISESTSDTSYTVAYLQSLIDMGASFALKDFDTFGGEIIYHYKGQFAASRDVADPSSITLGWGSCYIITDSSGQILSSHVYTDRQISFGSPILRTEYFAFEATQRQTVESAALGLRNAQELMQVGVQFRKTSRRLLPMVKVNDQIKNNYSITAKSRSNRMMWSTAGTIYFLDTLNKVVSLYKIDDDSISWSSIQRYMPSSSTTLIYLRDSTSCIGAIDSAGVVFTLDPNEHSPRQVQNGKVQGLSKVKTSTFTISAIATFMLIESTDGDGSWTLEQCNFRSSE